MKQPQKSARVKQVIVRETVATPRENVETYQGCTLGLTVYWTLKV